MAVHFTGPILFAGKEGTKKWFENLPHNENFDIPDKNFYKWVYSEAQNNFPVPWKGNINLITEIKGLITSCLAE